MAEAFVVDLAGVGRVDRERVGGKAAGLGELLRAGLPVPAGFCVTTAAYSRFALQPELADAFGAIGLVEADSSHLHSALEHLRAALLVTPVPADVEDTIRQACSRLGNEPLAVRSSANLEDLAAASFAGQLETFLNVIGPNALLDAVRRCWMSLWTDRAVDYRRRVGMDQPGIAMGIVVQVLVPADVAGVLFTANPSTGRRDEIVINASFGLGEAVVSGQVTPDTYVLDKYTLSLKLFQLGTKALSIVPMEHGGTRSVLAREPRTSEQALTEGRLHQLADLGRRVEAHFDGVPQDIEWAYAGDRCALLQSRPVTSLPPPPLENVRWEPPEPGSVWIRRQVAENLPEPLSTLFEELYLREGLERSLDELMTFFRMPWFHLEDITDRPFFTTVNGFAYQRASFKFGWKTMPIALRGAFDGWRVMFSDAESFWRDRALPAYLASVERWKTLDAAVLTNERLLAGVRELALADATYWYACAVVVAAAKMTDALLDRFLALAAPRRQLTSGLFLRGFASRSMAAQADLETLADQIMRSDGLPELVAATPAERLRQALACSPRGMLAIEALDSYLDKYGHQIYNLDFAEPTQAEDPFPVLLSIRALVARPGHNLANRQQNLAIQRKHLTAATARSFDPVRRLMFHKLLVWAERFGPYREEALFFMGKGWPTLRRLALELGKRGVAVGALDCADDVFHLESPEIAGALDPHASNDVRAGFATLAHERRELRQARRRLHPPAAVPPSRGLRFGPLNLAGFETQHRNALKGQLLRGFAVSPGKAMAEASLILSPSDFGRMQPGTILVCPTTTPAWTPLFSQARGLVTDVGGILAHGSIVAREYGIPAVMGTGNGTERIMHGQLIGVDGDRGEVELAPARHARDSCD